MKNPGAPRRGSSLQAPLRSVCHHTCRDVRALAKPAIVGLEAHAQPVVVHAQDARRVAADRIRPDDLHLLCHYADIGLVTPVVCEAIEAKPVVELPEVGDVVLHGDVRAASAATAATTTSAAAAAHAHATAAAAAHSAGCAVHSATATTHARSAAASSGDVSGARGALRSMVGRA